MKFFPYDKEGKRNNLKQLEGRNCLPDEIVKVDVKYQEVYPDAVKETPLEFWAGFIGLEQNNKTFALRPQIGWMVRKKDVNKEGLKSKLSADAQKDGWGSGINIRVKEFPAVLLELKEIKRLDIQFIDTINIPDEISKIKIGSLSLYGKITKEGIERIKRLLPDTDIKINGSRGGIPPFVTPKEAIKMHYPEKKGYSARNLAYMCQFARTFSVEVLQKMLSCDVKLKKPTIDNVQSATRILDNLQFVQEVPAQIKEIGRTISFMLQTSIGEIEHPALHY